jgi:hypothetical protein
MVENRRYLPGWLFPCKCEFRKINSKLEEMSMKISEVSALLVSVDAQLGKAKDEIVAKIAELQAALVNVDVPADAQAALDDLKVKAQALDDVVPDAPVA